MYILAHLQLHLLDSGQVRLCGNEMKGMSSDTSASTELCVWVGGWGGWVWGGVCMGVYVGEGRILVHKCVCVCVCVLSICVWYQYVIKLAPAAEAGKYRVQTHHEVYVHPSQWTGSCTHHLLPFNVGIGGLEWGRG